MSIGVPQFNNTPDDLKPTSLWLDDKPEEIRRLSDLLAYHGLPVDIKTTSTEAEATLRQRPYDLVLVDLRLAEPTTDGLSFSRYARRLIGNKYHRTIHFVAVTNYRHGYGSAETQRDIFTYVYDKDQLSNGSSKIFVEDCLFAAADSRVRAEHPDIGQSPIPDCVGPDMLSRTHHVRCDIGYVLRFEGAQALVRLWRRGKPGERTIRVFSRSFLNERGLAAAGQPLRIDTYETESDKAVITRIVPLQEHTKRSRRCLVREIDMGRFRDGSAQ